MQGVRRTSPASGTGPSVSVRRLEAQPSTTSTAQPVIKDSKFFLLINSNLAPKNNAQSARMTAALNDAMDRMLNNPRPLIAMREGNYDTDVIDIDSNYSIELGPEGRPSFKNLQRKGTRGRGGRIHAHALVEVQHTAKVQLNLAFIRMFVPTVLREHGFRVGAIYLNVKGFGSVRNILQYIGKDSPLARLVEFRGQ